MVIADPLVGDSDGAGVEGEVGTVGVVGGIGGDDGPFVFADNESPSLLPPEDEDDPPPLETNTATNTPTTIMSIRMIP